VGSGESYLSSTAQDLYWQHHYKALNGATATIDSHFDQLVV